MLKCGENFKNGGKSKSMLQFKKKKKNKIETSGVCENH